MSRIGKQIIEIPNGVTVTRNGLDITVKGPKGEISRTFFNEIEITIGEKEITLVPKEENPATKALWGTYASHIKNMIEGVTKAFEKKLEVEGVGFKWATDGSTVTLSLGFSHEVKVPIPAGINVVAEKNTMTVSGIDKDKVGQFAANIRALKKPEPYKGKGIRYAGEYIRRKQGKKSA